MQKVTEPSGYREPVLDFRGVETFPPSEITRQWTLFTESVRREMFHDSRVRDALIPFCNLPLEENLPYDFVNLLSATSAKCSRLAHRQQLLGEYLALPSIPDELMSPDTRMARVISAPNRVLESLTHIYADDPDKVAAEFQSRINSGSFLGITPEEKALVFQRYVFARDVKILALGAELLEYQDMPLDADGVLSLPSGTKIIIQANQSPDFYTATFSPDTWILRRQLKDRVYAVQTTAGEYILKERKTPRHYHTLKAGHEDGNTSIEEFKIAASLSNTNLEREDVSAYWEKPLLAVTFADGYQFVIFEAEQSLLKPSEVQDTLAAVIEMNREIYLQEYTVLAAQIMEIEPSAILSFDEYANVKAYIMISHAEDLLRELLFKAGYENRDFDDNFMFKIEQDAEDGVKLVIVGLDTEYVEAQSQALLERRRNTHLANRSRMYDLQMGDSMGEGRSITTCEYLAYKVLSES